MKQQNNKKKTSPSKPTNPLLTSNNLVAQLSKLRTSDLKFDERYSDMYLLRNSFSSAALRNQVQLQQNDFRLSKMPSMTNINNNNNTNKKNQFQALKSTLNKLENKVNAAKQQLQIPSSTMKKSPKLLIHYDQSQQSNQIQKQLPNTNPSESSISLKCSDKKLAALITNTPKPKNFKPVYTNPYSPRRNSVYYISQALRAVNQKNSLILQHINASIRIIKECEPYQIPELSQMQEKRLNLRRSQYYKKKKSLVLDLDQTLIHCVDNYQADADLRLTIKLQSDQSRPHSFGVNIRPYALSFLKKMSKKFEIIIFTASQQQYADAILNQLDPDNEIFQHRLYRQHCWVLENQMHVKDMRIINRNPYQIVLVDNAAYSYAFQLENGIPILPYYEGSDYELAALQSYLDQIQRVPDVRQLNKHTFKLHHYTKFCNGQQLIEQLYMNGSH